MDDEERRRKKNTGDEGGSEMSSKEDEEPKKKKKKKNVGGGGDEQTVPFVKLFSFADKYDVVLMIVGTVCSIVYGMAQPVMALVFGQLVNSFGSADRAHVVDEVSQVSLKYVYVAIGAGITSFLQVSCWMVTGERQATRIRASYLKAILRQDITFFDTEGATGEVIGRMSGDTVLIQDAMGEKVGKFIQLASTFFGGFAIAFIRGWHLTLVLVPCVPLIVAAGGTIAVIMSKMASRAQLAYAEAGNVVEQTIGGIRTVASFTGEKQAIERYDTKIRTAYVSMVHQGMASGFAGGIIMAIILCTYGLATWYGSHLIIHNGYTGGEVMNVIFAIMNAGMSLGQTTPCLNAFAAGKAAAYKMFETIKREPKIDPYDTSGIILEDVRGEIELKDVYFRYPARPDVQIFAGFSLYVQSGKTAALVGESGSGKSTVISLLERFYDPDQGEVLIDGVNLKSFRLSWIREQLGLVSQEPVLFGTSIKDNIAYGKAGATDGDIRTAVKLANAAKFIDKLPKGLDTMVGEHGTQLSGGQKQRIAIARAILKNPKILLLDEATSALDAESERVVQDALENVMRDRTTVVVAHRLTTIKNADLIAVVHRGKLVEQGTHDELIKNPEGAYSQLVLLQQGRNEGGQDMKSLDTKLSDTNLDMDKSISSSTSRRLSNSGSKRRGSDSNHELDNVLSSSTSPRLSHSRTLSKGSSSSHSFRLSLSVPGPILLREAPEAVREDIHVAEEVKDKKRRQVSILRLACLNKPELPILALGSIAACVHGVIFPNFGLLLSTTIKIFFEPPHALKKDSEKWALMFVGLGFCTLVAVPFQNSLFGIAGGRLIQRIRSLSFKKVVHQEISWFDDPSNSSGAIGARLSTDAATIRTVVGDALALIVQNVACIIAALVIAFTANWILTFVILGVFPFLLLQGLAQGRFTKGFSADAKAMYEEASQVASDAVGSIRTVASFCAENKVMNLYQKKCEGPKKHGVRLGLISGGGLGCSVCLLFCANALCFYIGAILIQHGKATFGQVFKVFFALTLSSIGISQSMSMLPDTNKAMDSIASIFQILDRSSKIDSSSNQGTTLGTVRGDIVLEHVKFKYPTRPDIQIFNDLSLTIPYGKTVALVGESGSGKSTVISLVERFYDPDSGRVLLDGVELKNLKLSWLRQQMGLVSQEPVLFNETIRANIAYGKEGEAAEEEIIAATRAANAHNFIASLPEGYDTNVGERGIQLSGGQKQRIAIARAILKNPKILLLDEATSALDAESERIVQEALDGVMVNRTTIVVAHRLTTIKGADKIAVVKNGAIAEQGTHDELMRIGDGTYASLVALHMTASPTTTQEE